MLQLTKTFNFRLLSTLLVFFLSQCFFVWLMVSSLNDFRRENLENLITMSTEAASARLNAVTTLGRSASNYQQASQILDDLMMQSKTEDAFITDAHGTIILGKSRNEITRLPIEEISNGTAALPEGTYCAVPFYDVKGEINGYTAAALNSATSYKITLDALPLKFYIQLGIMLLLSAAVCIFFNLRANKKHGNNGGKTTFKSFIVPFVIAQCLILTVTLPPFKQLLDDYISTANITLAGFVHAQFEHVAELDLTLNDVSGIDAYLTEIKNSMPAIGSLRVTDENGMLIAGDIEKAPNAVIMPVFGKSRGLIGCVELTENSSLIAGFALKLSLTLFTFFFIAAILAFELSSLAGCESARLASKKSKIPFEIALPRPISFCLVFAFYLPIAVTPIYMGRFADDFTDINETLIRSFAVSTEMLAIGVSSLLLLIFSSKFGRWPKILKLGIILLICGMSLSFLAPNGYIFLASRFFYGLGYGCVLVGVQLFTTAITTKQDRGTGFAGLFAGLYSGVLCGGCAGGLLAQKFGQANVYAISAILLLADLLLVSFLIKNRSEKTNEESSYKEFKPFKLQDTLTFMRNPQVLSLLFFQAIPYAIITIGFFNFFMPVFVTSHGFGTDTAGQLNFLYSLCIIFLTPIFGKIMDKSRHKYLLLSAGLLCSTAVPLIFNLNFALLAAVLAMLLLGISAAINESGQPMLISTFKAADKIGSNNAIMVLDTVLRAGQILGPLLVAGVFAGLGSQALGGLSVLCAILLIIFTLIQKKSAELKA